MELQPLNYQNRGFAADCRGFSGFYQFIEEIHDKLPGMAGNSITAVMVDTSSMPQLSIIPVQFGSDVDEGVADTLAQILAIQLIRTRKYAVYPRTKSLVFGSA